MPTIQFNQSTIQYKLVRKPKIKNISIRILNPLEIIVTAPTLVDQRYLDEVILKKAPWILKQLHTLAQRPEPPIPISFQSGDTIHYLGEPYTLIVKIKGADELSSSRRAVSLERNDRIFYLSMPQHLTDTISPSIARDIFKQWYIKNGNQVLIERLELYCPAMGVRPLKICLKEQKRRWGTCTGKGAIYLNWRLMMAPLSIVDYVLVHELAHLKHPNHSKQFWSFVESILPDYKLRKAWLRNNGNQLSL